MKLQSLISGLNAYIRSIGNKAAPSVTQGQLVVDLNDVNGNPLPLHDNETINTEQYGLPIALTSNNQTTILRSDSYGGINSATSQILFNVPVNWTTFNNRAFFLSSSTMTRAITPGDGVILNSASSIASNDYIIYRTSVAYPIVLNSPLVTRFKLKLNQIGILNTWYQFGFTNTNNASFAHLINGAYWTGDVTGLRPMLVHNSTPLVIGDDISSLITLNSTYIYEVIMTDTNYIFICIDSYTGKLVNKQILNLQPNDRSVVNDHQYSFIRVVNGSNAPATASRITMEAWTVIRLNLIMNYSSGELAASKGYEIGQNPSTGGNTSNFLNSTVPANMTLSNTNPGATYLEGVYRLPMASFALNTDYLILAYQVPERLTLVTRVIQITCKNLVAAVATTPTQIDFYLRYNATAASLVTAGYLTKHIGTQTFPVGAAIGSVATEKCIKLDLSSVPAISYSGRYQSIVARITSGTTSASRVIETIITVVGNFE